MAKLKVLRNEKSPAQIRSETYWFYINKYYSLFMNRYKIDGVDYQAKDFILRQMWGTGTIAAFLLAGSVGSEEQPNGLVVFTPYAPNDWNIYDFPTSVTLINKKGVKWIPSSVQVLDKDVVIGWCQRNKKSVKEMADYYIEKIVNIEIVIDINLNAHKMPYIFGVDPEDSRKFEEIYNLLQADNPSIFVAVNEVDKLKALVSGAPYILDKLYDLKHALENELREYFGLNNLGGAEKKEHLITAEVNANNDTIKSSGDCFLDSMTEFFDRVNELFNQNIRIYVEEYNEAESSPEDEQEEDIQDEADE